MPYPGGVTITVQDGGLQLVSGGANFPLIFGVSSAGVADTLYVGTDPQTFKAEVGRGPGVDIALDCIEVSGGCLFMKTNGGVAAANSVVTKTAIASSTGTVTVSGSAAHDFATKIRIRATGTVGAGKFDYSLDRSNANTDTERTYSEVITIPSGGTFVIPGSGLTLTFTAGAGPTFFEAGDYHTFTSTCAHYNTTDLGNAMTALLASPFLNGRKIRRVCWSGNPATAGAAATLAAAIATHMGTLATNKHFARSMMDGGSLSTSGTYLSAFASVFANTRVVAGWGFADVVSPQPFAGFGIPRVSCIHPAFVRAVQADISENLGRVASGPLRGVVSITADEAKSTQFTEADKTLTLRTDSSQNAGFFVTNGYLKSPAGSDYLYWDFGITLDEGATLIDQRLARYRLSKVRTVKTATTARTIDPRDAARIDMDLNAGLAEVLRGPTVDGFDSHVSEQQYSTDLTNDVLGTRVVRGTWRAVPNPPVENLEATIGLTRSVAV